MQVFETNTGMRREHDFVELDGNTLATDDFDTVRHTLKTSKCRLFNLEIELSGETDATHHTQRVVGKRYLRVEGRGNDAVLKVGNAVEGVDKLTKAGSVQADGHRVDSEITAVLVVFERAVLDNGFARVMAIALLAGSDKLNLHITHFDLSSTEILEDREVRLVAENALQLFCHLDATAHNNNVNVVGGTLEENVAHIPAHDVAFHVQMVGYTAYLVEDVLV